MYAGVQFSVLHPVRLHRQRVETGAGQPRQCAVLTSLLLRAGKPVSLSKLVEDVSGDDAPPSAAGSVRTYAYRLRQALGEQCDRSVSLVGGGCLPRIQPDALDLNRFEETTAWAREARTAGDLTSAASLLTEGREMWKGVSPGSRGRSRASSAAPARCVPRRRRGPLLPRNRRNEGNPCEHHDVAHPQRAPAAPPTAAAVHAPGCARRERLSPANWVTGLDGQPAHQPTTTVRKSVPHAAGESLVEIRRKPRP